MNKTNHHQIHLVRADEQDKPVIRNLMQLYQYDASEFSQEDPGPFGLFDYKYLDHYWTEHGKEKEGRVGYMIKAGESLAGFALINNFSILNKPDTRTIAEFFVMRKWRKQGVGKMAAFTLFDTHRGLWEVKQEKDNLIAQKFWETIIHQYTQGSYTKMESHLPQWEGPIIYFSN